MRIDVIARRQAGAFTRAQALGCGFSARQIDHRVATGRWLRLLPGVYAHRAAPVNARTRAWAALLCLIPDGVLSHATAAWLCGLVAAPASTHVTIPHGQRRKLPKPFIVHRRALVQADVRVVDGLRTTAAVRTVVDCLRTAGGAAGIALLDAALQRRLVTVEQLRREVDRGRGEVGNDQARTLIHRVDRSASEAERLLHRLLRAGGLRGWSANLPVTDDTGRVIAVVDLAFASVRLAIEIDGMAFHTDARRFQHDRNRQNALVAAGWTVLRFTWRDLTERPAYVTAQIRSTIDRLAAA